MLNHSNLKPNINSIKKSKRVWRWNGSWKWSFSWKWCKWQNARTWAKFNPNFEWGQTPLIRRMPKKRWFTSNFGIKYFVINVSLLEKLAVKWITEINKDVLISNWVLSNKNLYIKLLWDWELTKKINIVVNAASKQAISKIQKTWSKIDIEPVKITKLEKISYNKDNNVNKNIKSNTIKSEVKEIKKEKVLKNTTSSKKTKILNKNK